MERIEEIIYNEIPQDEVNALVTLSVPTVLTNELAERLLKRVVGTNGETQQIIENLQSYPIWHERSLNTWAFDKKIRQFGLTKLNGSTKQTKETVLDIYKNAKDIIETLSYTEFKDFELQIARLSLSVEKEQNSGIEKFRGYFEAADIFDNKDTSRVIEDYFEENNFNVSKSRKISQQVLSAYYMRGLNAYRKKQYGKAEKFLLPVWKKHFNNYQSIKDAAIAASLIGHIWSKKDSMFDKAEYAYNESAKLEKHNNNLYGLAQVYHSLGKLISKRIERKSEAENLYKKSIEIGETINNKYHLSQVYHSLAILLGNNNFSEAEAFFHKSEELKKEVNDMYGLAQVYHSIGRLYSSKNILYINAEKYYKKSIKIGERLNKKHHIAKVYHSYAILVTSENQTKAENLFIKSISILTDINDNYGLGQVYFNYAKLSMKNESRKIETIRLFEKSIYHRKLADDRYGLGLVYYTFGKYQYLHNENQYAISLLTEALQYENDSLKRKEIFAMINEIKKAP